MLLGAGAEVNLPTWEGVTPLQLASRRGDLALARLLLHWGASTGTSSLPITSLNLTPTMTYSELEEEEKKEKLVAKQKEEEMKSLQEKEVSNKKGDKVVKEKELKSEVNVNKEKEVTKKRGGRVNKGREATRRKEEMMAEEKLEEEKEEQERDTGVLDRMVMRAGCEVCGERGATLREVEGLLVCLPCTKQQQTSYSTVSSTPSSSSDSTTKPNRRAKKPTEN